MLREMLVNSVNIMRLQAGGRGRTGAWVGAEWHRDATGSELQQQEGDVFIDFASRFHLR